MDFPTENNERFNAKADEGKCRRNAPSAIDSKWTIVDETDWCGEWTMIEEAEAEERKVVK